MKLFKRELYDPTRYDVPADGSAVFDRVGGYYISRKLWDRWISEGRSATARHSFAYTDDNPKHEGMGFYTQTVKCGRCGERRQIGCDLAWLNRVERWCVA